MKSASLRVTFKQGRAYVAYYSLPHDSRDSSVRCEKFEPDLVVDFNADGRPIGIEIITPEAVTVSRFNRVLRKLGLPPVTKKELAPLHAA